MGKRKQPHPEFNAERIREFLDSVFGEYSTNKVEETDNGFNFEAAEGTPINFETLAKVADAFGTKDINFTNETIQTGYCETCYDSYTATIVRVANVTKWKV